MSGGMSATSIALMAAAAAGATISAVGAHQQGEMQKSMANQQANLMMQNANNDQAAAEQKAQQQDKQTSYVLSNAAAEAANSGGAVTDPTVNTNMKTIAGEGRYRSLIDLYQGDAAAQNERTQAEATRAGGASAARGANFQAASTILSSANSLYDRYNTSPKTPDAPADTTSKYAWAPWQQPGYVNP